MPEFLIRDLGIMWETVRSSLPIDADKFGDFCDLFTVRFNADPLINWYEFSPTLHKIIVHGRECMKFFPIPIGWLSEEVVIHSF